MSIFIDSPRLPDGSIRDVYVSENRIERIGSVPDENRSSAGRVIDGSDKLIVPSLLNGHSHAAMSLLRGWQDDLPLQEWLNENIWPVEDKLVPEDIYWGTRLAGLEMMKSGTTFFNDMYWEFEQICQAVEDSGMRARVSGVLIDHFDKDTSRKQIEQTKRNADVVRNYSDRVQFALGPHSVYAVSEESLAWAGEYAREHEVPMTIHLAETEKDVRQCKEKHGLTPVQYLDRLGALNERTVIAHGIWVNENDIQHIADRNARVVYNPIANLKLASGMDFPFDAYRSSGVPVCLGTDGVASNNNHDLFEEIKTAALLQKQLRNDPETLPAEQAFDLATRVPADVFDVPAGRLEEGALADLMMLDLRAPSMTPLHDAKSHLAYAASGGLVDTVICDGNVLMENRSVDQASEIRDRASDRAMKLVNS